MDEATVREHAEAHARAVKDGDLKSAGSDLTRESARQAPDVMGSIPSPVSSAEVKEIRQEGEDFVAVIVYSHEDVAATVESRWAERDGRPKITNLAVV